MNVFNSLIPILLSVVKHSLVSRSLVYHMCVYIVLRVWLGEVLPVSLMWKLFKIDCSFVGHKLGWNVNTPAQLHIPIRFTHMHHVPQAEHAFMGQQTKWIAQMLTHKLSPVVFHPIVEQLTVLCISWHILSSSILQVLGHDGTMSGMCQKGM